ncbi:MAG: hypothetical protein GF341_04860 [candidate division Zixibacteria bacterium]|nr:hypothetical protein [candidate division Zixibacteria bacterium]
MFRTIDDFKRTWEQTQGDTLKILDALTDESLSQSVADGHRTVGRIAWHIVQTIPEMMALTGLQVSGPDDKTPPPTDAAAIRKSYADTAAAFLREVTGKWSDETLQQTDELYGETWARGLTLLIIIVHEVHHRGQLTVLMRQAGLKVPGVFGPAKEEWATFGAPVPEI